MCINRIFCRAAAPLLDCTGSWATAFIFQIADMLPGFTATAGSQPASRLPPPFALCLDPGPQTTSRPHPQRSCHALRPPAGPLPVERSCSPRARTCATVDHCQRKEWAKHLGLSLNPPPPPSRAARAGGAVVRQYLGPPTSLWRVPPPPRAG